MGKPLIFKKSQNILIKWKINDNKSDYTVVTLDQLNQYFPNPADDGDLIADCIIDSAVDHWISNRIECEWGLVNHNENS